MQVYRIIGVGNTKFQNNRTNYMTNTNINDLTVPFGLSNRPTSVFDVFEEEVLPISSEAQRVIQKGIKAIKDLKAKKLPPELKGTVGENNVKFREAIDFEVIPKYSRYGKEPENYVVEVVDKKGVITTLLGYNAFCKMPCGVPYGYGYFDTAATEKWSNDLVKFLDPVLKQNSIK